MPPAPCLARGDLRLATPASHPWCLPFSRYELAAWLHMIEAGTKRSSSIQVLNLHAAGAVFRNAMLYVPRLVTVAALFQVWLSKTPLRFKWPILFQHSLSLLIINNNIK